MRDGRKKGEMRQPSVGCVGVELFKELKRQRDVDVRICTWRGPCRGWLEHLFSGWWVSPLTCSHHYGHHRSRLIKALPPWLTPRLLAHEREERGEQTWTVFAEDCGKRGTGGVGWALDKKGEMQTWLGRVLGCNKEQLQSLTACMHYLSHWTLADRDVWWKMPCRNKFWSFHPSS